MKNSEISLQTKTRLAQALKKAMIKKPLSKITVSELIKECNINRNTFYYHFTDIYDLLKWMFEQESIEVIKKINLLVDAEEAIRFVADYIDNNRHIINCAYDSMGHEEAKRFFFADFFGVIQGVIEAGLHQMNLSVSDEFKQHLAVFFTEALAGCMLDSIKSKEIYEKESMIQDTLFICRTSIPYLLKKRAEIEGAKPQ